MTNTTDDSTVVFDRVHRMTERAHDEGILATLVQIAIEGRQSEGDTGPWATAVLAASPAEQAYFVIEYLTGC